MKIIKYTYFIALFWLAKTNKIFADDSPQSEKQNSEANTDIEKKTPPSALNIDSESQKKTLNRSKDKIFDKVNLEISSENDGESPDKASVELENRNTPSASEVIKKNQKRKVRNACVASMFLPGLGQIFNNRIWKSAIIWTGFGGLSTGIAISHIKYMKSQKQNNAQRRWRNALIVGSIIWYAWNVFDAYVDAHMSTYDISENLNSDVMPGSEKKSTLKKKRKKKRKRRKKKK